MATFSLKSLSKAVSSNKVAMIMIFLVFAFLLYQSKILEGNTTKSVVKMGKNATKDTKNFAENSASKVNNEFKY
jgi:hypothetical protein